MPTGRCLARFRNRGGGAERVVLVCFPHAGAGPSLFHSWRAHLPGEVGLVGVRLPGRESRLAEPPLTTMEATVDHVTGELSAYAGVPLVLYGHCAGAVTAFHVAAALAGGGARVLRLGVAGCPAPALSAAMPRLADRSLSEISRSIGPVPRMPTALRADMEPVLRADLRILEDSGDAGRLDCPISAFHGTDDPILSLDQVAGWQQHTTAELTLRQLPAGHFLLDTSAAELVGALRADVLRDLG